MSRLSESDQPDDVAATLEGIREAVRKRAGYAAASDVPPLASKSPVTDAAELAHISAHLPVDWQTPVLGQGVSLTKRVTRLMLRWYINPIVDQQNAFNDSVVRALAYLEERQRELARKIEQRDLMAESPDE